jgi:pimeloyl-ACP methyl ester carboxylesterase
MDRAAGMARLAKALADQAEVISFDRRGYGRSRPHSGPFDVAGNVADVVALLDGQPAVLVGHSFGGNVVLAVAQEHPELVTGVAVYEAPLSWQPAWPGSSSRLDAGDPGNAAEGFMRRMIGDRAWERLPPTTRQARRDEGEALVGELGDLRREAPWFPDRIHVPVIVGCGDQGLEHHRRGAAWIAGEIDGARLITLVDADHGAHRSRAGDFARHLVIPLLNPEVS